MANERSGRDTAAPSDEPGSVRVSTSYLRLVTSGDEQDLGRAPTELDIPINIDSLPSGGEREDSGEIADSETPSPPEPSESARSGWTMEIRTYREKADLRLPIALAMLSIFGVIVMFIVTMALYHKQNLKIKQLDRAVAQTVSQPMPAEPKLQMPPALPPMTPVVAQSAPAFELPKLVQGSPMNPRVFRAETEAAPEPSDDWRAVQQALNNSGVLDQDIAVDGLPGEETGKAVLAFQKSVGGLAERERGVVGVATMAALTKMETDGLDAARDLSRASAKAYDKRRRSPNRQASASESPAQTPNVPEAQAQPATVEVVVVPNTAPEQPEPTASPESVTETATVSTKSPAGEATATASATATPPPKKPEPFEIIPSDELVSRRIAEYEAARTEWNNALARFRAAKKEREDKLVHRVEADRRKAIDKLVMSTGLMRAYTNLENALREFQRVECMHRLKSARKCRLPNPVIPDWESRYSLPGLI